MKSSFIIVFALLLVLCCFSFPVLANGADGSVAVEPVADPDASAPDQTTLEDLHNTLSVIQSQLWIILVVGLLGYIYKFLRLFF